MIFYSYKNPAIQASLRDAIMLPQASDGGTYMPRNIPRIPDALFRHLSEFSLNDIAYIVTDQLFGDEIDSATLKSIVSDTLTFDIPLRQIEPAIWSLELFHGPSKSFKDVGVRFLAKLLDYFHNFNADRTINLLVATAGPAVETIVRAFGDTDGVRVFMLYPSCRKNRIGWSAMGCDALNIIPVEVDGSFDDCHSMISQAFSDSDLTRRMILSSANSINIARLLPQTFYYFWAYAQLCRNNNEPRSLRFSVPSGNFGNLCAGVIAKRMGLPVAGFIAAENVNCPFNRLLLTGRAIEVCCVNTISDALDVGCPSNLPRLLHLYQESVTRLRQDIASATIDDRQTIATIIDVMKKHDYLLDPHSAVAYKALIDKIAPDETGVFLATAAPEKSRQTLAGIFNYDPLPDPDANPLPAETHPVRINATFPALKKFLLTQ